MSGELCKTCGIGFYLPSGRCDHCDRLRPCLFGLNTVQKCDAAIAERRQLISDMVGQLYPEILRNEIDLIVGHRNELMRVEREKEIRGVG